MPTRLNAPDVPLDHIHSEAVWQGIGERLRDSLNREKTDIPQRLGSLIARLPELDGETAPSLVPDMETH
ncbi:MAG: hypothetical protein ACJAVZ_002903 [Afipia broomeae]|jgi:hypothetical protein|uniref:Uncharacterized protein n=2 Tax=Pseudomonadota TaxID=1224 RepID=K8PDH7_9BRAD|nr:MULTISPECIES: hypothetical protein [Afipia]MAH71395.1 hypothetical protein [Afipia sp.]OUX59249.1 MAG: hypothetical protein CBB64_19410 [Afipia sp. TMED4]RAV93426.1 hypothetical protein DBT46_10685 [Aerococcus mictus]RTL74629.1 MAG: hypothetical protein EKK35_24495 [Bradyrhizobiaceae bacterium]EKS39616.1 hypothetical protein HMPREF9695_01577 [Afipia broomeae ATCC 49717]|tara:strand:- start:157 stop:363 length:207 start_codon:yes stop_codon:yes gene_type:complete